MPNHLVTAIALAALISDVGIGPIRHRRNGWRKTLQSFAINFLHATSLSPQRRAPQHKSGSMPLRDDRILRSQQNSPSRFAVSLRLQATATRDVCLEPRPPSFVGSGR
jgi:hypothetical protein